MRTGGVTTIAEKKGAENERCQRTEVTLMDLKMSVPGLSVLMCHVCILLLPHSAGLWV